ncbi:hypothetical protein INS49_008977 [Diaporthe citri]|uniref:uncharacterized protein n=1 Tax=Diaporthe citri TaxID=83186 RepID=UPI001C7F85B0|nr:uncharacterized protein INS49_008977 [Diaporthe citri]KAG6363874.1 hypothetical protein INS49_008977 [Diaporthe citri]
MSPQKYQLLGRDAEKGDSAYPHPPGHLSSSTGSAARSSGTILIGLGVIGAFFSGVIFTLVMIDIKSNYYGMGQYETGVREEKLLPADSIQLEQVRFKSAIDFEENGREFLVTDPADKAYVGATTKGIDHAWEEMLWGRYFSISESEAKSLWGDDYKDYRDHHRSGYTGGFDMFHQLHCLNQIRQALHRDVYPALPIHGPTHTEHCIDHLRQSIMCWGSTAVIPLKYFEGYHSEYVKTDAVHTCRKFEPIRQYVSDRFNGSLFVPRPSGHIDRESNAF